jgi:hypothetical protein
MYYGVLFVCSSTVVQYNSVTRPLTLSEVGCACPVLVLCLCFRSSGGEDSTYSWSDGEAIVLSCDIRDHQIPQYFQCERNDKNRQV